MGIASSLDSYIREMQNERSGVDARDPRRWSFAIEISGESHHLGTLQKNIVSQSSEVYRNAILVNLQVFELRRFREAIFGSFLVSARSRFGVCR